MGVAGYRSVLGRRAVRQVLLLSFVIRIPLWAGSVILTLHVVSHLGRSYGAAGLVVGVATVALSISAPWRGRRLDKVGLRAAVAPSLAVLVVCWSIAPFAGYWVLLVLSAVAGLFVVPQFSIVRQALVHAVDEHERRSALSIDSVVIELSFMIGPALGVLLATYWQTSWALFTCEFASIAGSALLWFVNPQLRPAADAGRSEGEPADAGDGHSVRTWMTPAVFAVLAMSAAAALVLSGTDVGVVAALRHVDRQTSIGWVLAVWGLGSAIGGLVYGALRRSVGVVLLLGGLAVTTLPVAFAGGPFPMAVLLFVAGLFCAPTITAALDALTQAVPEQYRGEAYGWHGSSMTIGSAAGAPIAGVAVDTVGWQGAFVLPGLLGVLAAVGGAVAMRRRAGRPEPAERVPVPAGRAWIPNRTRASRSASTAPTTRCWRRSGRSRWTTSDSIRPAAGGIFTTRRGPGRSSGSRSCPRPR